MAASRNRRDASKAIQVRRYVAVLHPARARRHEPDGPAVVTSRTHDRCYTGANVLILSAVLTAGLRPIAIIGADIRVGRGRMM